MSGGVSFMGDDMRKIVLLIAISIVALLSQRAFAQQYFNNYQYIIGERAAGMGGTYTAIANDSTALWYNPAGLARISDMHLNISGNTYSYLTTKTEGYVQLPKKSGGTESVNMEESDFSVVANTLIFGKKLGDGQAISFGIIIPYQDTLLGSMEAKELTNLVGGGKLSFKDETSLISKYYLAMLGYGAQVDNDLNVGASIGLGYYKAQYKDNWFLYDTDSATYESAQIGNTTIDYTQYTIQAGLGAQIEIDKSHKIGFYAQTPTYRLSGEAESKDIAYCANTYSGYRDCSRWEEDKLKSDPYKQVLPGFVSLGYGYEEPGSFGFSLDIVPVFSVSGGESDAKNIVVNVKTGLESYLSESMILRAGFFTDFSQKDSVKLTDDDGTDKIDYYGGTLSLSFGKHFSETEVNKERHNPTYTPVERTLWSTLGIVTRYGRGDVKVTRFDDNYEEIPQIKEKSVLNFQVFIAESVAF